MTYNPGPKAEIIQICWFLLEKTKARSWEFPYRIIIFTVGSRKAIIEIWVVSDSRLGFFSIQTTKEQRAPQHSNPRRQSLS